ncbi:glyoxalase/bleomycin resistance/dioxygenase family protein [Gallaecimonas kandeliae]|uniref:VOC family protein n=1 Tax=Gallaecimonas kandeliae TaxID=3029055 RepID=UPI002649BAD6|nr:VOC family protein [Gallaecimonas kandeliae]WKE65390.1 glyoxalase/bleomycin resistance/dioxygenase family protein [Gallaecimonas kandeliae]
MAGPAAAGALIYAKDLDRLSAFYRQLLAMELLHGSAELAVLESPAFQLLIHAIPPQYAKDISISSPPARRENCAIKLFFTVPDLAAAGALAGRLGGELFDEEWQGPGFVVRNAMDPEGNVFQLRQNH